MKGSGGENGGLAGGRVSSAPPSPDTPRLTPTGGSEAGGRPRGAAPALSRGARWFRSELAQIAAWTPRGTACRRRDIQIGARSRQPGQCLSEDALVALRASGYLRRRSRQQRERSCFGLTALNRSVWTSTPG